MDSKWPTHYIGTLRGAHVSPIRLQAAQCTSNKATATCFLEVVHTPPQQTKVGGSRLNLAELDALRALSPERCHVGRMECWKVPRFQRSYVLV